MRILSRIFLSNNRGDFVKLWKQAGLILGAAFVAAVVTAIVHPKRPAWYFVENPDLARWQISVEKARELLAAGTVVWVDARSQANFDQAHLPGAILLNPEDWGALMFAAQDELQTAFGNPVVVYCDGDRCARSTDVSQRLREMVGLDPVYILKGDWRELTGDVADAAR